MPWSLEEALPALAAKDSRMEAAIREIGGVTRMPMGGVFVTLVQSILGQQVSIKAADTVWQRMETALGQVTPQSVCACAPEALRGFGMSQRKAEYILGAAQAAVQGEIDYDALTDLDDEACISALTRLRGVGRWTAEMLLIFSLQRQNVMSYGDYGLRSGLCMLYHHKDMPEKRFRRYQRRFSPYGTAASLVLWAVAGGKAPQACGMPLRPARSPHNQNESANHFLPKA